MKKIIIIFTVLIFGILNVFAEENLDDFDVNNNVISNLQNQISIRDKLLLLKNNKIKNLKKDFNQKFLESEQENIILKNKIESLESDFNKKGLDILDKNDEFKNTIKNLQDDKAYLQKILRKNKKELFNERNKTFGYKDFFQSLFEKIKKDFNFLPEDDSPIVFIYLYLLNSLLLYSFFLIFTFPLRIIRYIWRKVTGYKECGGNYKNNLLKLEKKIISLNNENKKIKEKRNNLIYEIGDLEKKCRKLENKNTFSYGKNNKKENLIEEDFFKDYNFNSNVAKTNDKDEEFIFENLDKNKKEFVFEKQKENFKEKFSLFEKNDFNSDELLDNKKEEKLKIKDKFLNTTKNKKVINKEKKKFNLFDEKNKKSKLFE